MDVDGIISQLISLERRPIDLLTTKKTTLTNQKTAYAGVASKVSELLAAVDKLTKRAGDGSTIFDAKAGTSSDTTIATATATKNAANQSITLEVQSLPSATKARSTNLVGKFDNSTTVASLGISAGSFTMYSNGTAYSIAVGAGDTMGDVFNTIEAAIPDGVIDTSNPPTIVNGKIELNYYAGNTIQLGAGGDTSNFLAKTSLLTGINNGTDKITASQVNTTINTAVDISTAAANLNTAVAGGSTFSINGVAFDSTGKTLTSIISEINASSAGVNATFNLGSNKFELVSKTTGSTLINLADTSGNFLDAMGLISAGNSTASQTAGSNSQFVLNGVTMYATGTTVDETVTGLTGVSLKLNKAAVGTTVNITIGRDAAAVKTAIDDVVKKFNTVISTIDTQTNAQNKAVLAGDSRLKSLRNELRTLVSSAVGGLSGNAYDSLQQAGISTIASSGSATPTLVFDSSKFDTAYAADPDAIRKLFAGQDLGGALQGSSGDDNLEGTFTRISQLIDESTYTLANGTTGFGALYNGGTGAQGLFPSYQISMDDRIKTLNDNITKGEERLTKKEKLLRQQFTAMDKLVAQYQAQGNALNSLISQLNSSNS